MISADDLKKKHRVYMFLLYPDEETGAHASCVDKICKSSYRHCGILHDRDADTKPHYTIVVYFDNARYPNSVAKDFGIDVRWITVWDALHKAYRYLVHADEEDKFKYSTLDLFGNDIDVATGFCLRGDVQEEKQGFYAVVDIIRGWKGMIQYDAFFIRILESDLFPYYRKMGQIVFKMIDSHNAKVLDMSFNGWVDNV